MEGIHRSLGVCKVLTHSQGDLEAKGEPIARTTNTGQIMYRKKPTPRLDWNHRPPGDLPGATVVKPSEAT